MRFRSESGARAANRLSGFRSVEPLLLTRAVRVEVDPAGAERALAAFRARPDVEYADYDHVLRASLTPNDPRFSQQWGAQKIGAPLAWETTRSQASVRIAILDCGIFSGSSTRKASDGQRGHPDLRNKVIAEASFAGTATVDDNCNHGSHVAGIAAASTNNAVGVAGIGFDAVLLNGKVLNDQGDGTDSTVANGIIWAANQGAHVINMSLGGEGPCSPVLQDAVDHAWSRGAVIVAAAGNSARNGPESPGNCARVLSVAATLQSDARASYSNWGLDVDVAAPGSGILSLNRSGGYSTFSGTSMATPHVSGLAALLWNTPYGTSNQAVVDRITSTADRVAGTGSLWAHGRINAAAAVGATSATSTPTPTSTPTRTLTPSPTPTPTNTPTPTASPSETLTTTPEPTPTATSTETRTPSPAPTDTPSPTPTREPTATPTTEPTATAEPAATATPTLEPTASPTSSAEPSATPTAVPTETPAPAPSQTPTPTPSPTETRAPTATETASPSPTEIASPTPTDTPTPTWTASPTPTSTTTPTLPPLDPPESVEARPLDSFFVLVTWEDHSGAEAGFQVLRAEDKAGRPGRFQVVGTVGPNVAEFVDRLRRAPMAVCYKVVAVGDHAVSSSDGQACVRTIAPPRQIAPKNRSSRQDHQPRLVWASAVGATGYDLELSQAATFDTVEVSVATGQTSHTLGAALAPNTTYFWRVRATAGDPLEPDRSSWSSVWSFTTSP